MCIQVPAFKKVGNTSMPKITKTPGKDEGVQFDFKKLFDYVSCYERGLSIKSMKCTQHLKFYRLQNTQIITVRIVTSRLHSVLMVLSTAEDATSAFFHFQY